MFVYLPSIRSIPRSTIHLNKLCPFFIHRHSPITASSRCATDISTVSFKLYIQISISFTFLLEFPLCSYCLPVLSQYPSAEPHIWHFDFFLYMWGKYPEFTGILCLYMEGIFRNFLEIIHLKLVDLLMGQWERTYVQNLSLYLNSLTSGCYIYFQW